MPINESHGRLLTVAEEAFLRDGYGSTNLAQVARDSGISKKTIYKFVSSKADLFSSVIKGAIADVGAFSAFASADGSDMVGTLTDFLDAYAELSFSDKAVTINRLVVGEARQFPELARAYFESVDSTVTQTLVAWLQARMDEGSLELASASSAANVLISMVLAEPLHRARLGVEAPPRDDQRTQLVREAVNIFLFGASASRQSG